MGVRRNVAARGAVAATGLVMMTGLGALGPGVAGASPAAGSGKIYACYSDSTDQLYYLNYAATKSCPTGETMIYWNVEGPRGARGARGPQGPQGSQGVQGSQGTQGTQGAQRSQGPQGTQGAQGSQGPQGTQGVQGPQGSQGAQGVQGAQGAQGSQGVQGSQGAQGAPGPSQGYYGYGAYSTEVGASGSYRTVASVRLPPGDYTIQAKASVDWGQQGLAWCGVEESSDYSYALDSNYVEIPPAHNGHGDENLALDAGLALNSTRNITLVCGTYSGSGMFIARPRLTAERLGGLSVGFNPVQPKNHFHTKAQGPPRGSRP